MKLTNNISMSNVQPINKFTWLSQNLQNLAELSFTQLSSAKFYSYRILLFFTLVIAAFTFAARFFPHLPNFTPVGALALFAGAYLAPKTKWALLLPLPILFLSDLFLGFYEWQIMVLVYGSFLLYGTIGFLVSQKKNSFAVVVGTFGGALLFFLITNFGVWAFSSLYPHTMQGLWNAYVLAIPFFRSMLFGDLAYTGIFFGLHELLTSSIIARIVLLQGGIHDSKAWDSTTGSKQNRSAQSSLR